MTDRGGLTDDELRTMAALLCRYLEHDLDQLENWRVSTAHGDVTVEVRRAHTADPSGYDDLKAWLDRR